MERLMCNFQMASMNFLYPRLIRQPSNLEVLQGGGDEDQTSY